MCTILFALQAHPKYPLIVLSNRDEFYARPTREMHQWNDGSGIVAGKDLEAGGTWLGAHPSGRWAAVTNHRKLPQDGEFTHSRGHLISDFLKNGKGFDLDHLQAEQHLYNGYNLLLGQGHEVLYHSNRGGDSRMLTPGIYGLSNAFLDTPWPKVQRGKSQLQQWIKEGHNPSFEQAAQLMANEEQAPVEQLPETGIGLEWEKVLSPLFIKTEKYGTHCTSLIRADRQGKLEITERNYRHQSENSFILEKWTVPDTEKTL